MRSLLNATLTSFLITATALLSYRCQTHILEDTGDRVLQSNYSRKEISRVSTYLRILIRNLKQKRKIKPRAETRV